MAHDHRHPPTWLSGYADAVEGDPFDYHTPLADTGTALLVRSDRAHSAIAWRTAAVPAEAASGDHVQLVWLFGLDVAPTVHRFVLHADDQPLVSFHNPTEVSLEPWTIEGDHGASLTLRPTLVDRHGDLMGFACLRLPARLVTGGRPVTLRLTGEGGRSPVWFLVFQRAVEPTATVAPGAAIVGHGDDARRRLLLDITHLGEPGPLVVAADDGVGRTVDLAVGHNRVPVDLPPLAAAVDTDLAVTFPDATTQRLTVARRPVRPWTVDLVQHTHTDIGYTRPQTEILPEHLRFLDYALDFCDLTDDLPDDARFRWTCEATWPVREFVRHRPARQVDRLRRRVAEGRIALGALPFNLSELADDAVLAAMLEPIAELADAGLPVRLAMQNDVNGVAWCLADTLPPLGVDSS